MRLFEIRLYVCYIFFSRGASNGTLAHFKCSNQNQLSQYLERYAMSVSKMIGWSLVFAMLVLATHSVIVEPDEMVASSQESLAENTSLLNHL